MARLFCLLLVLATGLAQASATPAKPGEITIYEYTKTLMHIPMLASVLVYSIALIGCAVDFLIRWKQEKPGALRQFGKDGASGALLRFMFVYSSVGWIFGGMPAWIFLVTAFAIVPAFLWVGPACHRYRLRNEKPVGTE